MTPPTVDRSRAVPRPSVWRRIIAFIITALCFAYLYYRLDDAARREGLSLVDYMSQVFANVNWVPWLLLMMGYSCVYLAIDTLVLARSLKWFVREIPYRDILPIRASAYIISIFNEQVGKGAIAYYLNKRDEVPGWEVGSVMLFIMFCEMFYLLTWATIGFFVSRESLPASFGMIPPIALGALVFITLCLRASCKPLPQSSSPFGLGSSAARSCPKVSCGKSDFSTRSSWPGYATMERSSYYVLQPYYQLWQSIPLL